ncbi:MAG: GspE/PulE family protein [bacterium]|nr:GspE/PulE family protein [bacterium]
MVFFKDKEREEQVDEIRKKEAEDLAMILSQRYSLPYLDLSRMTVEIDAIKIVPEKDALEGKLVVFQKTGKKLQVAIESPNPEKTKFLIENLRKQGYALSLYIVSEESLKRAWKLYKEVPEYVETTAGIIEVSQDKLEKFIQETNTIEELQGLFASVADASSSNRKISEILEIILAGAISFDASDIHLEPQEEKVRLRFRLDGVLHDIYEIEYKIYNLLLSRVKLISGLKLNIKDSPQDGRFSIKTRNTDVEVRVSIIPEAYGESIVLRVLNPESIAVDFSQLGMEEKLQQIVAKELEKPNGMILTTGPTGSGKTTTLYAFLSKVKNSSSKIVTLEDPIEYHLKGIVQTQIKKSAGYDFADGLRSILRQDPDIIMVGEIRDFETADTALNAALTGHMVLSTLHTNHAAGTIPRLIDLGVNPNIIAPAINIAMAQRLVRKLCNDCKTKHVPNKEEITKIEKVLNSIPQNREKPDEEKIMIWKPTGCNKCNGIGYKGRIGIYEAILIENKMEKLILSSPSETAILEGAKEQDILNMSQDGIMKVLSGITSLEELERVVSI